MTDTEKRDMYIAAGVGGLALVLIFLYVHSAPMVSTGPDGLPDQLATAPIDQNPYNYNIQPYGGDGPLNIPARGPISIGGGSGGGKDCCNQCGTPDSNGYQDPGVLAFLKLLALGA